MSGWSVQGALAEQTQASQKLTVATNVSRGIERHLLLLVDAETGQRGYLFTGIEVWLGPFEAALQRIEAEMASVSSDQLLSRAQKDRWQALRQLTTEKLAELTTTVNLKRGGEADAARAVVLADQGRVKMDQIRGIVAAMLKEQDELIREQTLVLDNSRAHTRSTLLFGSSCLLALLVAAGVFVIRDTLRRNTELWMREGEAGVTAAMLGDQRIEVLAASVIDFLADYLGATVATFFTGSVPTGFSLKAGHALPLGERTRTVLVGDGITGQVVAMGKAKLVTNLAAGHVQFASTTGRSRPTSLLVLPTRAGNQINGVIELAFSSEVDGDELALLERTEIVIGAGVRMAEYRERLENQLEETQRLAEQLQAQQEELRVNNEELEEQSRALREAQTRLEEQQNTLEEANARLQDQTTTMAQQQSELEEVTEQLVVKNAELERSSQYKSNFMANMSHELRTPLNSTLLLARLLVENKDGNLTAEQITFAQTIHDAGHDLLDLINDVLDISKIEAGRIEPRPQTVSPAALASSLSRLFEPVAEDARLGFRVEIDANVPEDFRSDPQRVEQILKNLLSNAFKFTEHGEVVLTIARTDDDDRLSFAIKDTGVGIPGDSHDLVFEAFRQLDDGSARQHGGTGLGLAISRELARVLGGEITLHSSVGKGSTFTLTLPVKWHAPPPEPSTPVPTSTSPASTSPASTSPASTSPASTSPASTSSASTQPSTPMKPAASVASAAFVASAPSTTSSTSSRRTVPVRGATRAENNQPKTIIVVEDDAAFSAIIVRVVRGAGYEALVAETADAAVELVRHHMPRGVLLDIGLPDHSGLAVLDRLKRDPRTRHIPVHIVSGSSDKLQTAMAMGAVGFAVKPIGIDDLRRAVERLVARADARQKHVLVIERDETQRESVRALLSHNDVDVTTATSGAEAMQLLRERSFDCIVMDLAFPDESGEGLLQRLAQVDGFVLPPVIVYTARVLTPADEERLGRLSRSIIVKGARSPERLLDEVTLFLHQVESELPPDRQQMLRTSRDRDQIFEGRTLLIVEDDVRNIFALSRVLEPRGAKIEIARNGIEALQRLEANKDIDLVLMDIMMPGMDGLEATRQIRLQPKWAGLPIIALTAKAMRDDHDKCLAAGANDYVAKPIDVDKLVSLIRVWMPRRASRPS